MLEVISVHVPKCGGSSFSEALKRAYSSESIFFDYGDRPADPGAPSNLDPEGHLERHRASHASNIEAKAVVHGHFHVSKYDFVGDDCPRITFLRHPIDRLISHYYYWLKFPESNHSLHRYVVDNQLTLLEFSRLPFIRYFYTQVFFRQVDMARFDFIGACENITADTERLGRLLGKTIQIGHANANAFGGYREVRRETIEDAKTLARFRDTLADDIKFYERLLG